MTAYLSTAAVCVAATAVGIAICGRGRSWPWTAPAVGLAALTLLALVAVHLPGHGVTAAIAVGLATLAALAVIVRRSADPRPLMVGVALAVTVVAVCSLPFVANDRMGELGAWTNDDLSLHMAQAESLGDGGPRVTSPGYPNGPHAVVAALDSGLGADPSAGFTALLLAVPALTALTALAALDGSPWYLRLPGAALVGVPYLAVSYLAQGAFKEPMLALMLLGFLLTLRQWRRDPAPDVQIALALALTAAGGVAVFGVVALVWPAAALVWLALLEPSARRRLAAHGERLMRGRAAVVAAGVVALAGVLAAGAWAFFDEGPGQYIGDNDPGGNFTGQLHPLEALGVWRLTDFRQRMTDPLLNPGLLLALAVVAFGVLWCWRRRERVLLAGVLAGVTVYAVALPVTLAYFSGKALMIASVPLTLVAVKALIGVAGERPGAFRTVPALAAAVVLAAFILVAGASSALALRGAHVRPQERGPDLAAFRPLVRDALTVYLGRDNFALWELRGAKLRGFQSYDTPLGRGLPEGPLKSRTEIALPTVDFDSVDPFTLALARFVVAPRTAYASRAPANFRPIRRTRWHVLWERRGRTEPRRTLAEGDAPGKTLDCGTPGGRRLSRSRGVAYVRPAPVTASVSSATNGQSHSSTLRLGPGRWDISLRWRSDVPLHLRAGSLNATLPAYITDSSEFASAGTVRWRGGPLTVTISVPARRRVETQRAVELSTIAATRLDEPGRVVPLSEACGRYVDWYRVRLLQ